MDVRTNSLVRPSGTIDKDKEKLRIANNGVVQSEEQTLPIGGDGWEKSKMKKKRSCIKLDVSPSTTLTKPVNTFQETKQGMQQRLATDSRFFQFVMELLELENQMVSLNKLGWAYELLPLETTKIIIPLSMIGGVVLLVQTRKG
ncbi:hypothetical protein JHK85_027111 [Glycine max]|nr:hypothetical protein JHK85_027111 [Glycine max]